MQGILEAAKKNNSDKNELNQDSTNEPVKTPNLFSNIMLSLNVNTPDNRPFSKKGPRNRALIGNPEENLGKEDDKKSIFNLQLNDPALKSDQIHNDKKMMRSVAFVGEEIESPLKINGENQSPTKLPNLQENVQSPKAQLAPRIGFNLGNALGTLVGRRARKMISPRTLKNLQDRENALQSIDVLKSEGYDSLSKVQKDAWHDTIKNMKFFKDNYEDMERSIAQDNDLEQISFDNAVENIIRSFKFHSYEKGDLIFHKGSMSDLMYIIVDGKVNIYMHKSKEELSSQQKLLEEKMEEFKKQKRMVTSFTKKVNNDLGSRHPFKVIKELKNANLMTPHTMTLLMHYDSFDFIKIEEYLTLGIGKHDLYYKDEIPTFKKLVSLDNFVIFGELGVLQNQDRAATCVCGSSSMVLVSLTKKSFEQVFSVNQKKIVEKKNFFERNFIFHENTSDIHKFLYFFDEKHFNVGQFLYKEGLPGSHIFIVKKGNVAQLKRRKKYENDNVQTQLNEEKMPGYQNEQNKIYMNIDIIKENEFFCEELIFNNKLGLFTYMALSQPTIVYSITVENFMNSRDIFGGLHDRMVDQITKKINFRLERIHSIKKLEELKDPHNEIKASDMQLNGSLLKPSAWDNQVYKQNLININKDELEGSGGFDPLRNEMAKYLFDFEIRSKEQFYSSKEPMSVRLEKRIAILNKNDKQKFFKLRQIKKHNKLMSDDYIRQTVEKEFNALVKQKIKEVVKKRNESQNFLHNDSVYEEQTCTTDIFDEMPSNLQRYVLDEKNENGEGSVENKKVNKKMMKTITQGSEKLSSVSQHNVPIYSSKNIKKTEESPFSGMSKNIFKSKDEMVNLTKAINITEKMDVYLQDLDNAPERKSINDYLRQEVADNLKKEHVENSKNEHAENSKNNDTKGMTYYRERNEKLKQSTTGFSQTNQLKLDPKDFSVFSPKRATIGATYEKPIKTAKDQNLSLSMPYADLPHLKINKVDKILPSSRKASNAPNSFFLMKNFNKKGSDFVESKPFDYSQKFNKNQTVRSFGGSFINSSPRDATNQNQVRFRPNNLSTSLLKKTLSEHSVTMMKKDRLQTQSVESNILYENYNIQNDTFLLIKNLSGENKHLKTDVDTKIKTTRDCNIRIKRNRFAFSKGVETKDDYLLNDMPSYHKKMNETTINKSLIAAPCGISISEKVTHSLKQILCDKIYNLNCKIKEAINDKNADRSDQVENSNSLIVHNKSFMQTNQQNYTLNNQLINNNYLPNEMNCFSTTESYTNKYENFPRLKDIKDIPTKKSQATHNKKLLEEKHKKSVQKIKETECISGRQLKQIVQHNNNANNPKQIVQDQ